MAIVCDERDVVGISAHQHEGDLIILEFFLVWELMKKTDACCYYEFCHIYKHWESSSCNKHFDCFESEARNHEEELFYVLELKVVFWVGYATAALQVAWCWKLPAAKRSSVRRMKNSSERLGAKCEGPGWIAEAFWTPWFCIGISQRFSSMPNLPNGAKSIWICWDVLFFICKFSLNLSSQTPPKATVEAVKLGHPCWTGQGAMKIRTRRHIEGGMEKCLWKLPTLPFASPKKMAMESLSHNFVNLWDRAPEWLLACPNFRISTATCELCIFFKLKQL